MFRYRPIFIYLFIMIIVLKVQTDIRAESTQRVHRKSVTKIAALAITELFLCMRLCYINVKKNLPV
jgi:hypothetical protein